jgi:predicted nucleic acid-binding protein
LAAVILADSNVLIDIISNDPLWASWSRSRIADRADAGDIAVNQIVVAEVAPRFGSMAAFQGEIALWGLAFAEFGVDAAFEAGRAFITYRRNRGKDAPAVALPDFFIGGHAFVSNATILTRDPRFYRTYFPSVPLITPDKEDND